MIKNHNFLLIFLILCLISCNSNVLKEYQKKYFVFKKHINIPLKQKNIIDFMGIPTEYHFTYCKEDKNSTNPKIELKYKLNEILFQRAVKKLTENLESKKVLRKEEIRLIPSKAIMVNTKTESKYPLFFNSLIYNMVGINEVELNIISSTKIKCHCVGLNNRFYENISSGFVINEEELSINIWVLFW